MKTSKGIVSNVLSGLQKKAVSINVGEVKMVDHLNPIKLLQSPGKKFITAYDWSGVVHFWS